MSSQSRNYINDHPFRDQKIKELLAFLNNDAKMLDRPLSLESREALRRIEYKTVIRPLIIRDLEGGKNEFQCAKIYDVPVFHIKYIKANFL